MLPRSRCEVWRPARAQPRMTVLPKAIRAAGGTLRVWRAGRAQPRMTVLPKAICAAAVTLRGVVERWLRGAGDGRRHRGRGGLRILAFQKGRVLRGRWACARDAIGRRRSRERRWMGMARRTRRAGLDQREGRLLRVSRWPSGAWLSRSGGSPPGRDDHSTASMTPSGARAVTRKPRPGRQMD